MEKQYWDINEFSQYSGFAVSTIYNWINLKKIPYTKIKGTVRFHIERTKNWLDAKEVKPKAA